MSAYFRVTGRAAGLSLVLLAGLAGAALAQNPSSDDLIRSLRPGANFGGGTRGIRPASPMPEPSQSVRPAAAPGTSAGVRPAPSRTPVPAAPVATTAPQPSGPPTANLTVQFANGSAELTPAAMRTLNELGRALSNPALASSRFRIEGHTDTLGNPETNKVLSERRAAKVVDYLVERFRIDRARLEGVGMGEEGLLVPTPPQTLEPRNRRVQVVNTGA